MDFWGEPRDDPCPYSFSPERGYYPTSSTARPVRACRLCHDPRHSTDYCPRLPEYATAVNAARGFDPQRPRCVPHSYTYNSGWRNHPNSSYEGHQYPPYGLDYQEFYPEPQSFYQQGTPHQYYPAYEHSSPVSNPSSSMSTEEMLRTLTQHFATVRKWNSGTSVPMEFLSSVSLLLKMTNTLILMFYLKDVLKGTTGYLLKQGKPNNKETKKDSQTIKEQRRIAKQEACADRNWSSPARELSGSEARKRSQGNKHKTSLLKIQRLEKSRQSHKGARAWKLTKGTRAGEMCQQKSWSHREKRKATVPSLLD